MTWTLVICAYLTANGCGHEITAAYSGRTACYNALAAIRFSNPRHAAQTVAYCVEGGR